MFCPILQSVFHKRHVSEDIASRPEFEQLPEEMTRGGSCVVNPLGEFIAEPVFSEEKNIYADIDLDKIPEGHFDFDPVGHYARKDVFHLEVDETKRT
ncbi:hypothetical protein [Virgibacillus salidurans]|uniref:hypothetical protein n=1 Tax=Virgibacillus salidurans TaxID=2831673 RepID=UPI00351D0F22